MVNMGVVALRAVNRCSARRGKMKLKGSRRMG